jgi:hypothetical protein
VYLVSHFTDSVGNCILGKRELLFPKGKCDWVMQAIPAQATEAIRRSVCIENAGLKMRD